MINKKGFVNAFGSLTNAAKEIGCSRQSIYDWSKSGKIPEECTGGPTSSRGKNWHKIITDLGYNPKTMKPIKGRNKSSFA